MSVNLVIPREHMAPIPALNEALLPAVAELIGTQEVELQRRFMRRDFKVITVNWRSDTWIRDLLSPRERYEARWAALDGDETWHKLRHPVADDDLLVRLVVTAVNVVPWIALGQRIEVKMLGTGRATVGFFLLGGMPLHIAEVA